jgi:hypothetical protein
MPIRSRRMRSQDIPICTAIVARHPVLGPRYGEALAHLAAVWEKLLVGDGLIAEVFEEVSEGRSVVLGAGIAAFVTDDFVCELKKPPHFWLSREIVLRSALGQSPVLSDKELQRANSTGGLNIAVCQCGILPGDVARADVASGIMAAFVECLRGFQLKEHVLQGESLSHLEGARAAGVLLWSAGETCYKSFHDLPAETLLNECHVLGISRDNAYQHPGSWAASTFVYTPPRIAFNRSEQRLLFSALAGGTDQDLAAKLGISLAGVRKTWRIIYERAARAIPELASNSPHRNGEPAERGKERKHRILSFVRDHPEELRPVSRKLLRAVPSQTRPLTSY